MQEIAIDKLSPMMRHYLETKKEYPGCILFYRLGDFYEMFFDDARTVSKELDLALTGRACGLEERAPMCGVPYHASETYLTRLISRGYKVAICDQVEDPKTAKGMVKREVVRVVTPGTTLNLQALDETRHNYLMCVNYAPDLIGISAADITTGDFHVTQVRSVRELLDEIYRYEPAELVANDLFFISGIDLAELRERRGIALYPLAAKQLDADRCKHTLQSHFRVTSLAALGLDTLPAGMISAGALLQYLFENQKSDLSNFTRIYPYLQGRFMLLDNATRRNLELTETIRDKAKRGSLIWVLDKTMTAMGARKLRDFVEQPLTDIEAMQKRQGAVAAFFADPATRDEIREYLKPVYDLERLTARISYHTASPRDLLAFGSSLKMLPAVCKVLLVFPGSPGIREIAGELDPLEDLQALVESAILEDAPLNVRDGGFIRDEFDADVDRFRAADRDGKQWLLDLEEETRSKTGIKNLRIKFNNHFGYAFEVTNSFRDLVPEDFTRRQTLANCERYTTPRLKELEDTILNARERLNAAEYDAFVRVRDEIAGNIGRIQKTAGALAMLDAITSLAYVAERNRYVQPVLTEDATIHIRGGRHPVIEQMMDGSESFVENDTLLDDKDNTIAIITGPNMAGKSTYMRQTALIVLMAQIGSFVPATHAVIGIADRIFTRVGASDDLASGRSTFMVEMSEVAAILRAATGRSLLVLDEIGRGTSTCDGLSIARAVVEYLADPDRIHARTLFATHYHEMTALEGTLPGVLNYCSAVREKEDGVVFLHKIVRGGADKSYGIQVARLAGVPEEVLSRAMELARMTEEARADTDRNNRETPVPDPPEEEAEQMTLFALALASQRATKSVMEDLRAIDLNKTTPIEALNILSQLKQKLDAE